MTKTTGYRPFAPSPGDMSPLYHLGEGLASSSILIGEQIDVQHRPSPFININEFIVTDLNEHILVSILLFARHFAECWNEDLDEPNLALMESVISWRTDEITNCHFMHSPKSPTRAVTTGRCSHLLS